MCSLNLHLQVELASRQLQLQEMSQASTRNDENRWWENGIFCKIRWCNFKDQCSPPRKMVENGSIHHIFFRIRVGSTANWKMIFFILHLWHSMEPPAAEAKASSELQKNGPPALEAMQREFCEREVQVPKGCGDVISKFLWDFCETWLLTFKDPEIRGFSFKVVFFCILLTIFVPNKSNTSSLGGFGWWKFLCSAWDRAWGSKAASRAREAATREAAEQATAVAAKNPLGN